MRYILALFCVFVSSMGFCATISKEKCLSDENMVWVAANEECISKNPCGTEESQYCSFYKPRNITKKELYIPLMKLYAKVKYGITDCKLTKVGDIHYACVSDDNYIVFISDIDIQDKTPNKTDNKEQPDNKPNGKPITIQMSAYDAKIVKKDLNNALIEICKIIGGDPNEELIKPDYESSEYGMSGSCTRVMDSRCEIIGGMNTYESGKKICQMYDIQDILNIKIEKNY